MRTLGFACALISFSGAASETTCAQELDPAVVSGTVTDPTGAVIRNARVHVAVAAGTDPGKDLLSDAEGDFSVTLPPGTYTLTIQAPDFAPYTSTSLTLKPRARTRLAVHLAVAGRPEEISITPGQFEATDPDDTSGALVFEGEGLNLLSDDTATLQQQLNALAGGTGTPRFLIDGFSSTRLPAKSSIRSIRINRNPFSALFDSVGFGRVEVSTKPGTEKLHGSLDVLGTDQPLNAPNPYTGLQPPYHQFQEDGDLNGPLSRKSSFFASESIQHLANNAIVNVIDPQDLTSTLSEAVPAPQSTDTYALRVDHQFSDSNFAYIRDEWSQTHIVNSGITLLVTPDAAFTSNTLGNALQASDTQVFGPHAVNEVRFQYLRTRLRQDPNSTAPSVIVQGAFQSGGSPAQQLRDNQDAYDLQDLFEFDRGAHSVRAGFRFRGLRDANNSRFNFNGQYTFSDLASRDAGHAAQYSQTTGQSSATLLNDDLAVFAEDDWKLTRDLTFSYGLRFESESAIPDHSDPAPRIGLAWAIRRGKNSTPVVSLRGGYGIFYDRFPASSLLQAIHQNGTREIASIQQDTGFNPDGPPGAALTPAQPTVYRVDPRLHSSSYQVASLTASRMLGRRGTVSGTFLYQHNAHGFLDRNINAPEPVTGTRPFGNSNIYQFSSDANANLERFFVNYRLQLASTLFAFGRVNFEKNMGETDGINHFPSNEYNLRADYARLSVDRPQDFTGGLIWTLPHGFELTPFLAARSGIPFDITTGTDLNGDTIYNDRPALARGYGPAGVVPTPFGLFVAAPAPGQPAIPRNFGTSPGLFWLDLRAGKELHLGPRPAAATAAQSPGQTPAPLPDRPWELKFEVEAQNLTNHNNPGLPVGALGVQPCSSTQPVCNFTPSPLFGHSLSLADDFSPMTASNRTILLQTTFTF